MHKVLCLNVAMAAAYKLKCFHTAAVFARRILELGPPAQQADKTRKLLALVEKSPKDDVQLKYDSLNPFVVCAASLEPIYRGSPVVTSAYSGASYKPEYDGQVCSVDGMSKIGLTGSGLKLMN
jgi:coatomer protein complex subunit alpha (xenin)